MEGTHARARHQLLVDEHRHDGCLRQLLSRERAIVTQLGLGANLPEDAIYPYNLGDETGKPLDGANRYKIHFDKATLPPVGAFWSITLYDNEGYQVANALNRFAVSSWMPFRYGADGSLELMIQMKARAKITNRIGFPRRAGRST